MISNCSVFRANYLFANCSYFILTSLMHINVDKRDKGSYYLFINCLLQHTETLVNINVHCRVVLGSMVNLC